MTTTQTSEAAAYTALLAATEAMHAAQAAAEASVDGTDEEYLAAQVAADEAVTARRELFFAWERLCKANHPGENIYGPAGD